MENAYDDFKDKPKTRSVRSCNIFPVTVETGQVFVIDCTAEDDSVTREFYRSDGDDKRFGTPVMTEFTVE